MRAALRRAVALGAAGVALGFGSTDTAYELVEKVHTYSDGNGGELTGYLIYEELPASSPARPGLFVGVAPYGDGGGVHERAAAREYATKGMVVFLCDYFTGSHSEDDADQVLDILVRYPEFLADSEEAQRIIKLGYDELVGLDIVDGTKIGALGFCFGGSMLLNLARAGAYMTVAVSLHGEYPAYTTATGTWNTEYFAEIVGVDDPLIPAEGRDSWVSELSSSTAGGAGDYEMTLWGNTLHAFSIRYSETFRGVLAAAFGSTLTEDGVVGIWGYDEVRSESTFERVDFLYAKYGLIAN